MARVFHVVLLLVAVVASEAEKCKYNGKIFYENDRFNDGPCKECVCTKDGKVECMEMACIALACAPDMHFQPEDACCPVCKCQDDEYGHGIVKPGFEFDADGGCTHCTCTDSGTIMCTMQKCMTDLPCDEEYQVQDGCCTTCKPGYCYHDEKGIPILEFGEHWTSKDGCTHASCMDDGTLALANVDCPPLNCPDKYVKTKPGECCPFCLPGCAVEHRKEYYLVGEDFQDGCSTCVCMDDNAIQCHSMSCDVLPCHPALTVMDKDDCCPTCLPGCYVEGTGHVVANKSFTHESGCGSCTCHQDGSISCVGEACQALTCDPHAIEMRAHDCCPKCYGCIIDGKFVRPGVEYRKDPCTSCTCVREGFDTRIVCVSKSCAPCKEDEEPVPVPDKCCPKCERKHDSVCDLARCPKPRCSKKWQVKDQRGCCMKCKCKNKGDKANPFLPGQVVGEKCDGRVCNGETGKIVYTAPDCPRSVMCVDPVQDKDTCCYYCPNNRVTCWHPKTKKILTEGQYDFTRKEICTCAGDPWYPYAFCAKRKIKTKSFKSFIHCIAPWMRG